VCESPVRSLLFVSLVFSLFLGSAPGKVGPEGEIRAICFGDVIDQYGGFNSFVVIRIDPAIEATFVPSRPDYVGSYENAWRNMRIYMPRGYPRLVQEEDLIITSDADRRVFTAVWIDWLTKSVIDDGLGLEWLGSIASNNFESWEGTTLAGIAPVLPGQELDISGPFKTVVRDAEEPLMKALAWDESPPLANINTQVPKGGSSVWAIVDHPKRYPLMTYWKAGKGDVLCFSSKFPNGVMPWSRGWSFFPEAMIFMAYRTAGKRLPQDPYLFKRVLSSFDDYEQRKSFIYSLFSFVEKFGGRVDRLSKRMDALDSKKGRADEAYLDGDYEECLDILSELKDEQNLLTEASMAAKNTALLWVYVTEWFVTTGALFAGGFLIWTLMIRRRLYKQVGVTRLV